MFSPSESGSPGRRCDVIICREVEEKTDKSIMGFTRMLSTEKCNNRRVPFNVSFHRHIATLLRISVSLSFFLKDLAGRCSTSSVGEKMFSV